MADNRQICFNYYEWDFSRELKPKRDGARYQGKPVEDDLEQRKLLSDRTRRTKWYREALSC